MTETIPAGGDSAAGATLSQDVIRALTILNERQNGALHIHVQERYDRSKDELLRHPERTGDPARLANQAWGNAGKVVRSHARRMVPFSEQHHDIPDPAANPESIVAERTFRDYLAKLIELTPMGPRYRDILRALLAGDEAEEIATAGDISVKMARVRISRARARMRYAGSES